MATTYHHGALDLSGADLEVATAAGALRHDAAAGIMEWFVYDQLTSRLTEWTTVDTGA